MPAGIPAVGPGTLQKRTCTRAAASNCRAEDAWSPVQVTVPAGMTAVGPGTLQKRTQTRNAEGELATFHYNVPYAVPAAQIGLAAGAFCCLAVLLMLSEYLGMSLVQHWNFSDCMSALHQGCACMRCVLRSLLCSAPKLAAGCKSLRLPSIRLQSALYVRL